MKKALLVLLVLLITVQCRQNNTKTTKTTPKRNAQPVVQTASLSYDNFGINTDKYHIRNYRIKKNQSLYVLLKKLGLSPKKILATSRKAKKIINLQSFRPGQKYRAYFSKKNKKLKKLIWEPNGLIFVTFSWNNGKLQISRAAHVENEKLKRISGTIHASLYNAISDQQARAQLVKIFSNILAWQVDFTTLRKGDTFKILYEKNYVGGQYYDLGKILALKLNHKGKTYYAYHFHKGKLNGYFDKHGNSVQKSMLKTPFKYDERISSRFNPHRFNPVLHRYMPHNGVDFAAPYGTPVLSVGNGRVLEAHYGGPAGNIVKIRHNSTFTTVYMHLCRFAHGIHRGVHVKQGQVIGYVGHTGRVTGTNLHYGVYKNGKPVNPMTVNLPSAKSIPKKYMSAFKEVRDRLNQTLSVKNQNNIDSLRASLAP